MHLDPLNILVIDFGQLGDVILSLPALKAISDRFPDARKSIVVGSACAEIVRMTNLFDEVIPVDRVRLLWSNKVWSSIQILKFAYRIRRMRFDLVIDLHSLPETNLLGFFSGARRRLFANRESRSLDFLSNFRPKPPLEDKTINLALNYHKALEPLGLPIVEPAAAAMIQPSSEEIDAFNKTLIESGVTNETLIGINPGAGHQSRRWPIEKFVELSNRISKTERRAIVFLGPEEQGLLIDSNLRFDKRVIVPEVLKIPALAAAFTRISTLVSNDTGTMHLAAVMGTPVVLLLHSDSPDRYLPTSSSVTILRAESITDICVEQVFDTLSK